MEDLYIIYVYGMFCREALENAMSVGWMVSPSLSVI